MTLDLLNYLRENWSEGPLKGWYEGLAHGCPSTNNALESTNRSIFAKSKKVKMI